MSIPAGPSQSFCHPESEHRSQGKVEVLEMSIYVLGTCMSCMSMYWLYGHVAYSVTTSEVVHSADVMTQNSESFSFELLQGFTHLPIPTASQ